MDACSEIKIQFPEGLLTLENNQATGFRAFHHCEALRKDADAAQKTEMILHIGEGIGNEFYVSLACPRCPFKIKFRWKPESSAAMVGERIIRRSIDVSASTRKTIRDEISADQLPPDSVREHIMRSYSI